MEQVYGRSKSQVEGEKHHKNQVRETQEGIKHILASLLFLFTFFIYLISDQKVLLKKIQIEFYKISKIQGGNFREQEGNVGVRTSCFPWFGDGQVDSISVPS